jgi:two-component system chemotaxis response regulator CheY
VSYRILIVDDSPVVRKIVARSVEMAGFDVGTVHMAANGREGLAVLAQHKVDVVFADINMPEMSGLEMVEQMAADGVLPGQVVVILSTERSEERIARLRALGVRAYLKKPFKPEDLKKVVDMLFPATAPSVP